MIRISQSRYRRLLFAAAWVSCLLLFALIVWLRLFSVIGFELRYDLVFVGIFLAAVFYGLGWSFPGCRLLLLSFVSVYLCGSILVGVWESKVSDLSVMAGSFPVSDSYSYLNGSFRLMHTGTLTDVASRRPIAPAIGGALLFLAQGNVRVYLATLVLVAAIAMAWGANEIIRTHGLAAGYVMFFGQFLFYRRFIGTVLSEHVGFVLGILAFGMLWRAFFLKARELGFSGLFVLTIALCARAGAFFVLPALAIWGGLFWRGKRVFCASTFTLLCASIIVGFGVNMLLAKVVGTAEESFGNFSYTLYGVLHGGDWTQVLEDHPHIRELSESERNAHIYDLCRMRLREKPSSLVRGGYRAVGSMLISLDGPFSFVFFAHNRSIRTWPIGHSAGEETLYFLTTNDPWKYVHILAVYSLYFLFWIAAFAGVFVLLFQRGQPTSLLLFTGLGILASAPFAPPWDCDLIRVYAATIPFFLVYPSVAASALFQRYFADRQVDVSMEIRNLSSPSLVLVAWVVVPLVCFSSLFFWYHPVRPRSSNLVTQSGYPFHLQGVVMLNDPRPGRASGAARIRRNRGVLAVTRKDYTADLLLATQSGEALAMAYDHESHVLRYITYSPSETGHVTMERLPNQEHGLWWTLQPNR